MNPSTFISLNGGYIRPYDPIVFQNLADFHIAREELEQYKNAISSLGAIICKYELSDVVAINFLHKHFEISQEEIIVRSFETPTKALMYPVNTKSSISNCVPYLWAFSANSGRETGWYPVEFMEWDEEHCPDLYLLSFADGFLLELGEKLQNLNLQNVFGIAALYSRSKFEIGKGETLIETTDEINKVLTLSVAKEDFEDNPEVTQTMWVFE